MKTGAVVSTGARSAERRDLASTISSQSGTEGLSARPFGPWSRRRKSLHSTRAWIAAALLLGLAACREDAPEAAPVRPVLSVVATVRTTDTLGPFAGTIEPRYKSDLGFRIFGRMVARFVDVGAVVTRDQELAALDPAVQALAVRSAEATVANAEAQFVNAAAEEGRQRDLAQRNITPQAQFELIQRNRETAEANLTRARASLRKAKDLLSFTQLKADFDGVVTGRYAEPGQVVNAGQKIVTVARPEIREAVIAVPNELADALSHPNAFTMTVDLDHVVSMKAAAVRSIDPTADSSTRMRGVFLTLDNPPAAFRLGITIGVTLTRPVSPRIDLPATALLAKDGKSFVWLVDPARSTVALHEVTVLARDDDTVTVTAGSGAADLAVGARVVIAGAHSLAPGQAVKVTR
jgi:membrane fusion protein, multidrug efflux system